MHPAYAGWYCLFLGYPLFHRKGVEAAVSRIMDVTSSQFNIEWLAKYGTPVAWTVLVAFIGFWWDANNKRMETEETVLRDKFPEYESYSNRVKRVIPYLF